MKGRQMRMLVGILTLMTILTVGLTQAQDQRAQEGAAPAAMVGTAFTYQGRLSDGSGPVNGTCDLVFRLYDEAGSGSPPTGGTLLGTVVDAKGSRLPHRSVVVSQPGRAVKIRADALGEFRLTGLRGGLYVVGADGRQQACRVWAPATAPPCATEKLLVVGGGEAVRGQIGGPAYRQWMVDNAGSITLISAFIALPIIYATKPYGS